MLSWVQIRKFTRFFNVLDRNAKGYLTEEDIYCVGLEMAQKNGITEQNEQWPELVSNIDFIWNQAQKHSVCGDPDKIFLIDWLEHLKVVISDKNSSERYIAKIGQDIFDLFSDQQSKMTTEAYIAAYNCFGIDSYILDWTYKNHLSIREEGLNRKDYLELVKDFYLATDQNAPGNFLFGPF